MPTLVVIGYADQSVAEDARKSVRELEDELTIRADHAASIARDVEGRYHAHISHRGPSPGEGADWGGFWGPLFGMLFSIPTAGLAFEAELGAPRDSLGEIGIGERFSDQVRKQVKPGTSAVFLLVERAPPDKAVSALACYSGTVISTSLSAAEFERLRSALRMPVRAETSAEAGKLSG